MGKCIKIMNGGKRCNQPTKEKTNYCSFHDDERNGELSLARRRGKAIVKAACRRATKPRVAKKAAKKK